MITLKIETPAGLTVSGATVDELVTTLDKIVRYADTEPEGGATVAMHRTNIERARAVLAKVAVPKPLKASAKTIDRLRVITTQPWRLHSTAYNACRFCGRNGRLWKYGVRHYCCELCRDQIVATADRVKA